MWTGFVPVFHTVLYHLHREPGVHTLDTPAGPMEIRRSVTWSRLVVDDSACHALVSDMEAPACSDGARALSLRAFTPAEEESKAPTLPPSAAALQSRLLRRLRALLRASLSWRPCWDAHAHAGAPASYANLARTIATSAHVHRPGSDAAIAAIIRAARGTGLSVRVAGAGGALSPCVASEADAHRALLFDLSAYSEPSHPSLRIDRATCTVWVNAGWSLSKLCARVQLQFPRLFLPAAAAGGPAATAGGAVASAAHGTSADCGLLADAVVALRVIGADGAARLVRDADELRLWRCSFGLLGIVTHVRFQFVRLASCSPAHREVSLRVPRAGGGEDEGALAAVREALGLGVDGAPAWREFYWSPYSGRLLRCAWDVRAADGAADRAADRLARHSTAEVAPHAGEEEAGGPTRGHGALKSPSAVKRSSSAQSAQSAQSLDGFAGGFAGPPRTYASDVFVTDSVHSRAPAPAGQGRGGEPRRGRTAAAPAGRGGAAAAARWAPLFTEAARWSAAGCAAAVDCVLDEAARALADPSLEPHDAVFVQRPRESVCLGYLIPLDARCRNALRALQVVAEVSRELREADAPVKLDLPVELRVLRRAAAARAGLLSPLCPPLDAAAGGGAEPRFANAAAADAAALRSSGESSAAAASASAARLEREQAAQELYLAIELPVLTAGGSIDGAFRACAGAAGAGPGAKAGEAASASAGALSHTQALAKAYARVEAGWRAISPLCRPQLGCVFGFSPLKGSAGGQLVPFSRAALRDAVGPKQRRLFRERMRELDPEGVFRNGREWADLLLGGDADAAYHTMRRGD